MVRSFLLVLLALSCPVERCAAGKLVAVAIKYLQITGTSHSHIYLYDWNGHLIRRLTGTAVAQDIDPVISPDGREIVFKRRLMANDEWWMVGVPGQNAHKINQPPEWYTTAQTNAPRFVLLNLEWERYYERALKPAAEATPEPTPNETPEPERIAAPDRSIEIVLARTGEATRDYDQQERGGLYRVRDLAKDEESLLGSWKDFGTVWNPLHLRGQDSHFFLSEPPLQTVFFYRHLNSTDGSRIYALDFRRKSVIALSSNGATPVPISGEPYFFAIAEERYRPLGDGTRTANCSYLDLWNAQFEKVRFGRGVPAIFNGGCLYRRGKPPLVISN